MPLSRRRVFHVLGGGVSLALAGCFYSTPFSRSRAQRFEPEEHVEDWNDEPVRGRGDPVVGEQTVDSPPPVEEQCGWEAEDAVESAVKERANRPSAVQVSYTKSSELPDSGWFVSVSRVIVLSPEGKVRQLPEIAFDTILYAAPRTVSMTVGDGSDTVSCRYEVYVEDKVQQMD